MNFFPSICFYSGPHQFELLPLTAARAGGIVEMDFGLYDVATKWLKYLEQDHRPRPSLNDAEFAFTLCPERRVQEIAFSSPVRLTLAGRPAFFFGPDSEGEEYPQTVHTSVEGGPVRTSRIENDADMRHAIDEFLSVLSLTRVANGIDDQLRATIEELVIVWRDIADAVPPQDRRVGDALAAAAEEVVLVDDPPREPLRGMLNWFKSRASMWADAAIAGSGDAFGKAFGTAAGVGAGAAVTGQLPRLISLVDKAVTLLS